MIKLKTSVVSHQSVESSSQYIVSSIKHLLICVICIFNLYNLCSQNIEFDKKNFPDKKEEFKQAYDALMEGEKLFREGVEQCQYLINNFGASEKYCKEAKLKFDLALEFFLKANQFNPNNGELNFKIGVCYLHSIIKTNAIPYLEKAYKLNPNIDPPYIHYLLGKAYQLNLEWDKAIAEYEKQLSAFSPQEYERQSERIKKKIYECQNGKELMKNPVRVYIENIGDVINSPFPEYNPLITADESMLFFTARKDNTTGGKRAEEDNIYFEDIYVSYKKDGKWTDPEQFPKPINSDKHDAVVGLSPDGQHFFIYKYKMSDGGDIYECVAMGDGWSNPKRISKTINTEFHETCASFSYDMNTIYFVSDKEGGYGAHDIYMSIRDKKGSWGEAVNLGHVINTKYDEDGVFMHPDGKTLYFSSKGHNSMGGFDIFKTVYKNGQWTKPENLGYPINSADDDIFFTVNASGTHAYYTSARKEGMGEQDIYVIYFLGHEKLMTLSTEDNLFASLSKPVSTTLMEQAVEIKTMNLTLLKGTVFDAETNDPVEAEIDLVDNEKQEIIATFKSNSKTGKFLVSLPSGKNYGIAVEAQGYLFHSENFDIPATAGYQEVNKDIGLKKVEVGSTIILRNIFFDFDKATLRPESYAELERLSQLLTEVPNLRIEISGHTDSKGSDEYNLTLSDKRAKVVVDYLIQQKGITASRLEYKGYGETKPIADNTNLDGSDNPEGRQLNRRTEFKILSK